MNDHAVSRPVVDVAKSETRNQRIVAASLAFLVFVPELVTSLGLYEFDPVQMNDITQFLTLMAAVLLGFMAEQTKTNALYVETQVTSTFDPVKTVFNKSN